MSEKLEPLQPLSPEDAEIFARRRESESVVQHSCQVCGIWYETNKMNAAFRETFNCDCGARMSFAVPALEVPRAPLNEEILAAFDPDQRLDTGMRAKEARQRAATWWERKGRKLMLEAALRQAVPAGGSEKGMGGAFATKVADDPRFLPSGLIHGEPWDTLTKREKIMVVKCWHHFFVRRPDLIGDPEERFAMQDRHTIN